MNKPSMYVGAFNERLALAERRFWICMGVIFVLLTVIFGQALYILHLWKGTQ